MPDTIYADVSVIGCWIDGDKLWVRTVIDKNEYDGIIARENKEALFGNIITHENLVEMMDSIKKKYGISNV